HSLAVARLDLSRSLDSVARSQSAQIVLSQSLDSISRCHSTRSLAVTRRALCGYSSWIALSQLLSRSFSCSRLDRSLTVTRLALSQSLDRSVVTQRSLAVTRGHSRSLDSLSRSRSSHSRSLDSLSCGHSTRSLTFTRSFCRHSTILSSLGGYSWSLESLSHGHSTRSLSVESLAVTQLALSLSLDSLSRSHLIIMSSLYRSVVTRPFCHHSTVLSSLDRSVVTRPFCRHSAQIILSQSLGSISRSHWTRSLAVTQLALCCYSSRLALS
ncbi:hypothetical protein HID58_066885, partial [Brassica napus]